MASLDRSKRQIGQNLDADEDIVLNFSIYDILVGLVPPLTVFIMVMRLVPSQYQFFGMLLIVPVALISILTVFASPDHLRATEWLSGILRYQIRPSELSHVTKEYARVRQQEEPIPTSPLDTETTTQELTHIDAVSPYLSYLERTDGSFVGLLEVTPTNMAFVRSSTWNRYASILADVLNNQINFPIQIYSTTEELNIDEYMSGFEDRLDDPDVRESPILEELIRKHLDWYPTELERRGTRMRRYFIVVTVDESDIWGSGTDQETIATRLEELPVVSGLVEALDSGKQETTPEQIESRKIKELYRRLSAIQGSKLTKIDGIDIIQVQSPELVTILKNFWDGESDSNQAIQKSINRTGVAAWNETKERVNEDRGMESGEE